MRIECCIILEWESKHLQSGLSGAVQSNWQKDQTLEASPDEWTNHVLQLNCHYVFGPPTPTSLEKHARTHTTFTSWENINVNEKNAFIAVKKAIN